MMSSQRTCRFKWVCINYLELPVMFFVHELSACIFRQREVCGFGIFGYDFIFRIGEAEIYALAVF